MGIIDNAKHIWRELNVAERLIVVNVAIFGVMLLLSLVASLCGIDLMRSVDWMVECPGSVVSLLMRPWTLLTYMFVHTDFFHLLFNMLWLYGFSSVFLLTSDSRRLMALYIAGGVGGALFFIVATMVSTPDFYEPTLVGASASVLAIVAATTIAHPDYRCRVMFIGDVAMKWLGIAAALLTLLGGGSFAAHLGGIAVGVGYGVMLRRGRDLSLPMLGAWDNMVRLVRSRPKGVVPPPIPGSMREREEAMDAILDKVRRSGYASLTRSEKAMLIGLSKTVNSDRK